MFEKLLKETVFCQLKRFVPTAFLLETPKQK